MTDYNDYFDKIIIELSSKVKYEQLLNGKDCVNTISLEHCPAILLGWFFKTITDTKKFK